MNRVSPNTDVLVWARESMNLTLEDVAKRMNKTEDEIKSWESGKFKPTYVQLEKLAYKIYHRPVALFFFPNVPEEDRIEQSFRTLPDTEIRKIPPKIHLLLRKAKIMQMNLTELSEYMEDSDRNILYDLNINSTVLPDDMANSVRDYLRIDIAEQKSWKSTDIAFKNWRIALEKCGIFVFKDSFSSKGSKDSPYSGFCLYDYSFPIIYINNNNPSTRQIFTLFHELAHLLMQTGGIDSEKDSYIEQLSGNEKKVEILCNQFAAEFLVPTEDFNRISIKRDLSENDIVKWANIYKTSREAILRKLLEQNRVSKQYYEEKSLEWSNQSRMNQGKGGGNYFATKFSYLGFSYIDLIFRVYNRGIISVEQAADYLDTKVKHVSKIEDLLYSKMKIEK